MPKENPTDASGVGLTDGSTTATSQALGEPEGQAEPIPLNCDNGLIEAPEGCNDGNLINEDACLNNCQPAHCGDGVIWSDIESCDPTSAQPTPKCVDLMKSSMILHTPEQRVDCTTTCAFETSVCAYSGDGIIQTQYQEKCDDPRLNSK